MEKFLNLFYGPQWENERKQILLRINSTLIPINNEIQKNENKVKQKITHRKMKHFEQYNSEMSLVLKQVNDYQQKINQKLIKSNERSKAKHQKYLEYIEKVSSE